MKLCALLPIKHNSSRVPGKNYRDFNGKPLFMIILDVLLKVDKLDDIIVDTNSDLIKNLIKDNYTNNKIKIYNRPEHLWDGDIPMNTILENVINDMNLDHDYFIQTHTTNPLLSVNTLNKSIEVFLEKNKEGYDSLFSVKKWQTRLYEYGKNEKIIPVNHNPNELLPTQDLKPLFEENSCIFIFNKKNLIKKGHRIGYNPYMFEMDDIESMDIDIETDFVIAENVYKNLVLNNNKGKVVLITGSNGGIGESTCKKFKKEGWTVIGSSYSSKIENNIDLFIKADLTKESDIIKVIDNIKKKYNRLDCIVNNAAYQICKPIEEMEIDDWNRTYDCNVKSIYLFVKYGLDLLKKTEGNIINVGSVHSIVTSNNISSYASSKSAIVGLTKNLAIELSKHKIRVNCISPGAVDTKMLRDGLKRGHVGSGSEVELIDNLGKKHLLGRVGKPNEIANLIEFVANKNNGEFINGANILIDGGACIKLSTE